MNQTRRILTSLRLANSLFLTRFIGIHSLYHHQVTHFSPSLLPLFVKPHTFNLLGTHQSFLFSSKPEPIVELLLSQNWSKQLENELSESRPELSHGTVIYILKRLDKDPLKAYNFFIWVVENSGFKTSSAVYSLLLQILGNTKSMKEFWVIITKMKEQGFFIDGDTYRTILTDFKNLKMVNDASVLTHFYNRMIQDNAMDSVVKEVIAIVMRSDWSLKVEKILSAMKISLSDNFVVRVLMELRQCPSKALRIFKWFDEGCNFEHNIMTYNALVRVLGRCESINEFWGMIEEMKRKGHDLDFDTYVKISRRFQKNKMLKDAVELYEHMMDGPYKPSDNEVSLLLRSISATKNPDVDLVFRVVDKYYKAAGHSLSKSFYDGIHRSLTSVGRFDEAEKIMEAMRNSGYEPDNITYSQLIYGLSKAGRLQEACQVLDVMEENGCVPDLKTWSILIEAHCADSEVDKAMFYYAKMMENNIDADAELLDVLVTGFLDQRNISGAHKLLVDLVKNACLIPKQATYKNLIQNLLGERNFEEALNLLHLMRKHNYPHFQEPFIEFISKFGDVENALNFLKALSYKDYPAVPVYHRVFKSLFHKGRHSEAKDLLYKCPFHIRKHPTVCSLFGSLESSNTGSA